MIQTSWIWTGTMLKVCWITDNQDNQDRIISLAWANVLFATSMSPARHRTAVKGQKYRRKCAGTKLSLMLMRILFTALLTTPTSVVAFVGASYICNKIPGLTPKQRIMCQERPNAIVVVNEGTHMGSEECRRQFKNHRWNCISKEEPYSVFGHDQKLGTREAAYENAIRAAGVLHAVVTACGEGSLRGCGCDQTKRGYYIDTSRSRWKRRYSARKPSAIDSWIWGGCSIDLNHGLNYSKEFWDAREVRQDARGLMNLHNYQAGRKAVVRNVKLECKCHGVSASCTSRTCWVTLPEFRKVGSVLKESYARAKKVTAYRTRVRHQYLVQVKRGKKIKPPKRDLIYLEDSPTYCRNNKEVGSYGTFGRICNRTSHALNNCHHLCCERGYNTVQKTRKWDCKCKFYWCCHVKCEQCRENTKQYTCL